MASLFLGYLLDYEGEGPGIGKLEVYNPDIPGYFILSCASQDSSSPYIQVKAGAVYLDFVSSNCTGDTAYIGIGYDPLAIFRNGSVNRFFIVDTTSPPISNDQLKSRLELQTGQCHPASLSGSLHFPAREISFPFAGALKQGNDFLQYPIRIGPVE